jgi:hypothetical protein
MNPPPYSKAFLQNYPEIFTKEEEMKFIDSCMNYISEQILNAARRRSEPDQRKKILKFMDIVYRKDTGTYIISDKVKIISLIVEKTKEYFPDSEIQVDPLQTYMIISWN